jgi:hypothetical protein
MQVNVTISINGPSGQELAATSSGKSVRVTVREPGPDGEEASIDVTLGDLRVFMARLEAFNAS